MDIVYDLWFIREYDKREDTQLHIGIYASEEAALFPSDSIDGLIASDCCEGRQSPGGCKKNVAVKHL